MTTAHEQWGLDLKKLSQFTLKEQSEIANIYNDMGYWTIVLKNYDRVISDECWTNVKWQLKQMVKRNDFTLEW